MPALLSKYISTFSGSIFALAYPKAQSILPQFASCPYIAAFVRLDVTTDLARVTALSFDLALRIFTSNNAVAPSPSPAIFFDKIHLYYEEPL